MAEVGTIGQTGLAFIRRLSGEDFAACWEHLADDIGHEPCLELRMPDTDRAPAISLLSSSEVRYQKGLRDLPAQNTVRNILSNMPGLLDSYDVDLVWVDLLSPKKSNDRFIVLGEATDKHRARLERQSIFRRLGHLSTNGRARYAVRNTDVTAFYVHPEASDETVREAKTQIKKLLPIKATLAPVHSKPRLHQLVSESN